MNSSNSKKLPDVYQYSTINALAEGLYDGELDFEELKGHGNFGIGTLNNLDGEMIGFDGKFYQVKSDGSINEVNDNQKTPFSIVTNFDIHDQFDIDKVVSYEALLNIISIRLPSENYIYAIRVDGKFDSIVTRSVPKQVDRVRLVDVIPFQSVFEYPEETTGTMVGFYFPQFMKDINVVGYHFHFLSDDRNKGGHLLDLRTHGISVKICCIRNFRMALPGNKDFKDQELMKIEESEMDTIEKIKR